MEPEGVMEMSSPGPTKYGTPHEVRFCRRCVMSNQRPSSRPEHSIRAADAIPALHIDPEGVGDACRCAEQKARIDWVDRERQLEVLLSRYRSKEGAPDCIVPGSGGKDSIYAAHALKYKYGMHPLTVTWPPILYTDVGLRNFRAWVFNPRFAVEFGDTDGAAGHFKVAIVVGPIGIEGGGEVDAQTVVLGAVVHFSADIHAGDVITERDDALNGDLHHVTRAGLPVGAE